MGFPASAKIFRYGILAAVALAAAFVAVLWLTTTPAAAQRGGGFGDTSKSWDTDNLRFGVYSARSFAIPHLKLSQRGSHEACGSGVVDGFFQLDPDVRNDLPILDVTVSSDGTPSVTHIAAGTCSDFVAAQELAVSGSSGNGGYFLDHRGVLRKNLPAHVPIRNYRTQRWSDDPRTYQSGRFRIDANAGSYGFSGYAARIDYYTGAKSLANTVFRPNVRFAVPHSIELVVNTQKSGSVYTWTPVFPASTRVTAARAVHLITTDYLSLCPSGFHPRGEDAVRRIGNGTGRTLSSLDQPYETALADQYWCRSDVRKQIWYTPEPTALTCGPGRARACPTGVTIPTEEFQAYGRVGCYYTATGLETTGMRRGSRAVQGTLKNTCSYIYPVPQCTENGTKKPIARDKLDSRYVAPINSPGVFPFASDGTTECDTNPRCTDGGSKRDMTDAELQAYRTARGASFAPKADGSTPCESPPRCTQNGVKRDFTQAELQAYRAANFAPAADGSTPCSTFSSVACVTAILEIFENRPKGFNAEPGVISNHRTQTADTANPAYDLDVTSPHPSTASPPRAASDPSGCADGPEARADHGAASSAARKNTAAADATTTDTKTLPKSSAAVNTQHPPHSKNFGSAGTDYTGAVRNIAHRFASDVAENTCAVKRVEANLRLEMLESEANIYQDWMTRYSAWADGMETGFSDWLDNNPALSTSSADNATFGSYKHAVRRGLRRTYASGMESFYAGRKNRSASVAGRSLTKPAVGSSWCGDVSSLIGSYESSVGSLKTAATGVLSLGSAPTNPGSGPSAPDVSPSIAPSSGYVSSSADGTAPAPAVYRTTDHSSSYCHTSGAIPRSGEYLGTLVTYTTGEECEKTVKEKNCFRNNRECQLYHENACDTCGC